MEFGSISAELVVVALAAVALGALIKGVTGLGLPLVAVPTIATFASVEEAVVLVIIPTFGSNLWLVGTHRQFAGLLSGHVPFLAAGLAGSIIGTFLLTAIDDRWLKLALAVWLAVYLAQFVVGNVLRSLFQAKGAAAAAVGFTAGTIHGATGISSHIVAPYFHGRSLAPDAYAFLVACAFLTFSAAQLVTAASTQLFTADRLLIGLVALLPTLVFTQAGIRLARIVSDSAFQKILIAVFVLMEIKLITDVFS
ncbi:MAG: sulfite exporter TauE/SafE family protein [Gammaproteobacteria bacterium]|nr:sulfite exporter TauE/SafE family protein [Gammaproteobacteria bacterium]NND48268.1 sulfite exporter TauE/SafE family protein [Woeseiaceae bacterium]NNL44989.1 sulfite exporter TauE/SafE family protein [Woeseiaceae bacterium]